MSVIEGRVLLRWASIALLVFTIGTGVPCMAIERARYTVVSSQAPYEIRDYERSLLALVTVDGSRSDAVSSGFRLLADYIFGSNQQQATIAMTAPVTQAPQAAVDSITANAWVVRFMMPSGYTMQSLPTPTNQRVRFEQAPAHRVAAIRFSGFWSDANLASHERDLSQWIHARHLSPQSTASFAYYDPPWTPWFMRRIEVLIDVAPI